MVPKVIRPSKKTLKAKKLRPLVKRVNKSTRLEISTDRKALKEDGPFSGLV